MDILDYKKLLPETNEPWASVIAGSINQNTIRIRSMANIEVKWHIHDDSDEFFMVLEGSVFIDTEHGINELREKEFFIVAAGIKHRVRTEDSCKLLVIDNYKTTVA